MSRIPSGPPYPHQLPPQPPAGYYGNPPPPLASNPLPPVMHQGLPPPPTAYPPDPNIYPFERHPQSINSGWTTAGPIPGPGPPGSAGGIPIEAYNAAAGPSRPTTGVDPYQAYAQPARSSPSQPLPPRQQPGVPWSSVQPIATPTSNSRGGVKLEDLVSTSDRRPAPASGPGTGPKGSNPPQNVVVVNENGKRPNTSAGNDATGGGGQQGPSEFIKKLYKMLEEESAVYGKGKAAGQPRGKDGKRGSVGWGRGGMSFVVWDMNDFTTKVLPQTFRHSNFSSFVRQLNKYGFSKIKHVDEESGTIKENVWEFQHPNFQAGGKSELENIKRKAVAPRKTVGEGEDTSPKGFGLSAEDASRINVMENRIVTLESKLDRALEEVREARARESGVMSVLKEVIGHLAASERATSGSPMSEGNYSPRILHLFKSFDSIAAPVSRSAPSTGYGAPVSALPYPPQIPNQYSMSATPSFNPLYTNAGTSQTSPRTDGTASRGSRGSISGPVPGSAGGLRHVSGAPSRMGSISGPVAAPPPTAQPHQQAIVPPPTAIPAAAPIPADQVIPKEEIIEQHSEMPTLYNGEPLGMTPIFAENPAWLTEGNQAPLPMYHRKSSDGSTLRMMYDVLSGGGVNNPTGRFTEEGNAVPLTATNTSTGAVDVNALDTIQEQETTEVSQQAQASQIVDMVIPPPGGFETADLSDIKGTSAVSVSATTSGPVDGNIISAPSTNGINGHSASSSSSSKPFGKKSSPKSTHHHGGGSTIKPHWATTPKILVVEDDLVYRQLSSKFLSKFGCVTETVENAQGAVEKMNKDKYDLVLMDIFFGPNMDGRKATSLIRQFDNYTPIISMTSNAQPQDVDSYIRSGMNDILAKPFTKHGLFLILDKHLMHLRQAQIYEKIIPISVGVPPLSDQHVQEALAISAATIQNQGNAGLLMGLSGAGDLTNNGDMINGTGSGTGEDGHDEEVMMRNPLAGSGWSDETYQLVLQQFLATGMMPDVNSLSNGSIGSIGTGIIFGDSSTMSSGFVSPSGNGNNRKRPIEALNDDGTVIPTEWDGTGTGTAQQGMDMGMGMINGITIGFVPSGSSFMNSGNDADGGRENKRAKGVVG